MNTINAEDYLAIKHFRFLRQTFGECVTSILEYAMDDFDLWITNDYHVLAIHPDVSTETILNSYPRALRVGRFDKQSRLFDMWTETVATLKADRRL